MFNATVMEIFSYLVGGFLTISMVLYVVFGYTWLPKYMHRTFQDAGIEDK